MEENKTASIAVNLNDGSISISGSEEFVEKNKESIFAFVEKNIRCSYKIDPDTEKPSEAQKNDSPTKNATKQPKETGSEEEDKYIKAGVYHIDVNDDSISILKTIPGTNKAEKAKNIALIVLYIRKEKIYGKDIIPICEKHNCYDNKNFSSTFKKEKTNIIRKGNGTNWTIEITHPGQIAAKGLLEEMSSDKK